jgi:hypothetical protein
MWLVPDVDQFDKELKRALHGEFKKEDATKNLLRSIAAKQQEGMMAKIGDKKSAVSFGDDLDTKPKAGKAAAVPVSSKPALKQSQSPSRAIVSVAPARGPASSTSSAATSPSSNKGGTPATAAKSNAPVKQLRR